jgi:hypothetical protein
MSIHDARILNCLNIIHKQYESLATALATREMGPMELQPKKYSFNHDVGWSISSGATDTSVLHLGESVNNR